MLLGESQQDLQKMLYCVYNWSKKFKIKFNVRKSNIVHFRNHNELNIVEHYKYLGIILNEFQDYDVTAQVHSLMLQTEP